MKRWIFIIILSLSSFIYALDHQNPETVHVPDLLKNIAGNTLFKLSNAYLTLMIYEDNVPVLLRVFDAEGELMFHKQYPRVINLCLSENKKYAAFYTNKEICILNLLDFSESYHRGGLLFNINSQGELDFTEGIVSRFVPERLKNYSEKDGYDSLNIPVVIQNIHEEILCPLSAEDMHLPIGNSYGETQNYSGLPYLHPGVDFLGDPYQAVYAVRSGYVKAVLTTGGDLYWRVAIANSDTDSMSIGYLYAHLNQESISVNIGDYVEAGQQIGTLVDWPSFNFTHCHFARIQSSGVIWDGNWWTVNNPLVDMPDFLDDSAPVFENMLINDTETTPFLFKTQTGTYLSDYISGQVSIIAKCYDLSNADWKLDIYKMGYKLSKADNPDSVVFYRHAFCFDMPTDVYFSEMAYNNLLLPLIYNTDESFMSIGNYIDREYYHIISHSDGDSLLTLSDSLQFFDTNLFEDGSYFMTVFAEDSKANYSESSRQIEICNTQVDEENDKSKIIDLQQNYPNPFKDLICIGFSLKESACVDLRIYNIKGQLVDKSNSYDFSKGQHMLMWNAENKGLSSGIYIYRMRANSSEVCKKMILIK